MDTLLEQATPRPWRIDGKDHRWLAENDEGQYVYVDDPANAQLIVRAVNAYEPLVKAQAAARFVAEHWRDSYLEEVRRGNSLYGIGTHPLSLVLAALDGETNPRELGLPDSADADFAAALATVESSPEREGGE